MIIDKIQLAGPDAYFRDPGNAGSRNLAGQVTSRTQPLRAGQQHQVSALEILLQSESVDLLDLFNVQDEPLFSITVMKEMFPGLFADPFRNRVHTIAGFDDFRRGVFENARAMEVDGIPTIMSMGPGPCSWKSALYRLPQIVGLAHAAWELAVSRNTASDAFRYALNLHAFDENRTLIQIVHLTNPLNVTQPGTLDPIAPRAVRGMALEGVAFYQLELTANVHRDLALYERHTNLIGDSAGTPLLRAINLLEPGQSIYDIYSLHELRCLCAEHHLFEAQGPPVRKMLARLDLSALLVHSSNANQTDRYEFVEVSVRSDRFAAVEVRLIAEELLDVTP